VHLQGPAPQQLEHDGIGHVVAAVGEAVGPVAFSSLCATRDWVASDIARAFMRAYRRARECVIQAPAHEIAAREAEAGLFPAIDRSVLARAIAAYQQLGCWQPDPTITRTACGNLLDVFLYSGTIGRRHSYEAVIVPPPDQPA
jgi:NitT/TauT family transport system substrate-binding protein